MSQITITIDIERLKSELRGEETEIGLALQSTVSLDPLYELLYAHGFAVCQYCERWCDVAKWIDKNAACAECVEDTETSTLI